MSSLGRPAVLCLRTEPRCPAALWLFRKLKSSSWAELVAKKGKKNRADGKLDADMKETSKNTAHKCQKGWDDCIHGDVSQTDHALNDELPMRWELRGKENKWHHATWPRAHVHRPRTAETAAVPAKTVTSIPNSINAQIRLIIIPKSRDDKQSMKRVPNGAEKRCSLPHSPVDSPTLIIEITGQPTFCSFHNVWHLFSAGWWIIKTGNLLELDTA